MTSAIDRAMTSGTAALVRAQAADGSFPLHTREGSGPWRPCSALFSTASIVLTAGPMLPRTVVERAAGYLRRSRRPDGLWEFDSALRIPPDADSTSCSLAALAIHGGGADLEGGASLLRSFWRTDGGPFMTWHHATGDWAARDRDDAVVNGNVVLALASLGTPATPDELAAVRRLMQKSAQRARYYLAPSAIAYAARRAGIGLDALPPAAVARPSAGDLLAAAQWLCGMRLADAALVDGLLATQRADGLWPIQPWCTAAGHPTPVWGSEAVTTAYALEALALTPDSARPAGAR